MGHFLTQARKIIIKKIHSNKTFLYFLKKSFTYTLGSGIFWFQDQKTFLYFLKKIKFSYISGSGTFQKNFLYFRRELSKLEK